MRRPPWAEGIAGHHDHATNAGCTRGPHRADHGGGRDARQGDWPRRGGGRRPAHPQRSRRQARHRSQFGCDERARLGRGDGRDQAPPRPPRRTRQQCRHRHAGRCRADEPCRLAPGAGRQRGWRVPRLQACNAAAGDIQRAGHRQPIVGVGPGRRRQPGRLQCLEGCRAPAHQVGGAIGRPQKSARALQFGASGVCRRRHDGCDCRRNPQPRPGPGRA